MSCCAISWGTSHFLHYPSSKCDILSSVLRSTMQVYCNCWPLKLRRFRDLDGARSKPSLNVNAAIIHMSCCGMLVEDMHRLIWIRKTIFMLRFRTLGFFGISVREWSKTTSIVLTFCIQPSMHMVDLLRTYLAASEFSLTAQGSIDSEEVIIHTLHQTLHSL